MNIALSRMGGFAKMLFKMQRRGIYRTLCINYSFILGIVDSIYKIRSFIAIINIFET